MAKLGQVNLNRLLVFVTAVEAGSLTAAAKRLGIAKTMASAHMQRLEAEVGASLLLRTTRRLSLTEAGETFFRASRDILRAADAAVQAAASNSAEPRGTLRMTSTVDYSAEVLAPVAVALRRRYPDLKIELLAVDRMVDLVAEGIDVAIRVGELADSGYRATRIAAFTECLVASPRLLDEQRLPAQPKDLAAFPFIALSVLAQPASWLFRGPERRTQRVRLTPALQFNTADAVRRAALAGGGLAVLPDFAVAADLQAGRLQAVLPRWRLRTAGIHAVYPAARHVPQKVRVLIEALKAHVTATPQGTA
jgi:DNA-binding transcriptional LysR family regulator